MPMPISDLPALARPAEGARRVLVTGAAGFIGAWILRTLVREGWEPVVFDLSRDRRLVAEICGAAIAETLDWITGDIANADDLHSAARGTDAIIHLAGLLTPGCRANPARGAQINLIGLLNVFAAAKALGHERVLYMSSAGVYGPDGGSIPQPTTLYGAFKLAGEICAKAFAADDGISSIGIRPYVVYGPGREQGLSAGPSLAARAIGEGRSYTISFTGPLDMIHVGDVAEAFVTALETKLEGAHIVNLFGQRLEAEAVARELQLLAPSGLTVNAEGPAMPIVLPQADDSSNLLKAWSPRPLAEGLAQTIEFYRTRARIVA
jgi:UDP-glucose 4-epimerase